MRAVFHMTFKAGSSADIAEVKRILESNKVKYTFDGDTFYLEVKWSTCKSQLPR